MITAALTYCDTIRNEMTPTGPQASINGILSSINVFVIPTHYTFWVSIAISGIDTECENILRFEFISPSGEIIFTTNNIILSAIPNINADGLQLNVELKNIFLNSEGKHTSKLYINSEIIKQVDIDVVKKERRS